MFCISSCGHKYCRKKDMKCILTIFIVLTFSVMLPAQTRIYSGHSANRSDCLFTIRGDKVYEGNSANYSDCLFTMVDGKIYTGNSTNYPDCLLTIKGNEVFRGNSTNYSDCLASVDGIVKYALIAVLIGPY